MKPNLDLVACSSKSCPLLLRRGSLNNRTIDAFDDLKQLKFIVKEIN